MYVCILRNDWIHLSIVNKLSNFAYCLSNGSYKMDAKGKSLRLLELIHTTRSHLHVHLNTHTQTGTRKTCTHTRTTHSRTYVLFKPCVCRPHSSGLKCVSKVLILISLCVLCHFWLYISHVISLKTGLFIMLHEQCLLFNCL